MLHYMSEWYMYGNGRERRAGDVGLQKDIKRYKRRNGRWGFVLRATWTV